MVHKIDLLHQSPFDEPGRFTGHITTTTNIAISTSTVWTWKQVLDCTIYAANVAYWIKKNLHFLREYEIKYLHADK